MRQNFINKNEMGLPLYAITSMQNELYPFLCQSAVLVRRKFAACFLSNSRILLSVSHVKI